MATINIRRDVADPFYRYKMEKLQSKIEGKGNGIKTVIVNLSSVAQSLARPSAYVIKYFGFELGAQTTTNPADDRWIINGAHEAAKLQDYLDGFIAKFVLCKKCKNPETDVVIKAATITLDCKACGQRSDVDPRLKLSSFILKNEPKKGKKEKGDKKARRAAKANKDTNGDAVNGEHGSPGSISDNGDEDYEDMAPEAGSDDELTARFNAEAAEIETLKIKDKDVEWAMDTSEAAVKARAQELPDDLNTKLTLDEDEDGDGGANNAYDQLGEWIGEEAKAKSGVDNVDAVDIYVKAKELGIESKHKTLTVLAQTIFDENIVAQITKRAGMLKKMITSEKHEKAFLGGTERFIGNEHPDLIAQVPKILLAFYQEDVLTEPTLQTWKKASKKYVDINVSKTVRKAALPFLTWLETAESDDSGSDEE